MKRSPYLSQKLTDLLDYPVAQACFEALTDLVQQGCHFDLHPRLTDNPFALSPAALLAENKLMLNLHLMTTASQMLSDSFLWQSIAWHEEGHWIDPYRHKRTAHRIENTRNEIDLILKCWEHLPEAKQVALLNQTIPLLRDGKMRDAVNLALEHLNPFVCLDRAGVERILVPLQASIRQYEQTCHKSELFCDAVSVAMSPDPEGIVTFLENFDRLTLRLWQRLDIDIAKERPKQPYFQHPPIQQRIERVHQQLSGKALPSEWDRQLREIADRSAACAVRSV